MQVPQYKYGEAFLDHTSKSGRESSGPIIGTLLSYLTINSVLDVGCAVGSWLRAWQDAGIADFHGIDGPYVDQSRLAISRSNYTSVDLRRPFNLGRTYDLVQSLEVAEHLPGDNSETFVECLTSHSERFVLFSAAPPGQGGEFHVNERPYEFWQGLFEPYGFVTADFLRPLIVNNKKISYWYRYNILLFVRDEVVSSLPDQVRASILAPGVAAPDVSPLLFRIRKALLKSVPPMLQNKIAHLKSITFPTRRF